jgi:alkyl hydroperoxide reductase subunit AhpC
MAKAQDGCVKPAGGPIQTKGPPAATPAERNGEGTAMTAQVGKQAPDFEASAFIDGGFRNIKLTHKVWQEEEPAKMVDGGVPFPMLTDAGGRIG